MQPQLSPPISLSSPRHPPPPYRYSIQCAHLLILNKSAVYIQYPEKSKTLRMYFIEHAKCYISLKPWRKVEVNQRNPCNEIFGLILTRSFLIQDQIVYEKQLRKQKAWFLIWLVNLVSSSSWRGLIFFLSLHVCMYFTYVWMGKQLQRQENIDKTFLTCL